MFEQVFLCAHSSIPVDLKTDGQQVSLNYGHVLTKKSPHA